MKYLNEVARMQQLAGINEIKIINPLHPFFDESNHNLHPYIVDNKQIIKDSIDSFLENWDGIDINGTENPESSDGLLSYIQESLSNIGDNSSIYNEDNDNDIEFYENSLETFVNRYLRSLKIKQTWHI